MTDSSQGHLPEPVLVNLRKFRRHKPATCLHCGYSGLMGFRRNLCPWILSWWSILAVVLLISYFIPLPALVTPVAMFLALLKYYFTRQQLNCPSCGKDIVLR